MSKWPWIFGGMFLLLAASAKATNETMPGKSLTARDFGKMYAAFALQSQIATSVPALVTLAQAALESGWGSAAYGNNFFGIKANPSWAGQTQLLRTTEYGSTGNPVTDKITDQVLSITKPYSEGNNTSKYLYRVRAKFRAYPSAKEGFIDHGSFLKDNSRYKKAFAYTHDPEQFAREVAKAGYATAPDYADVLVNTMRKIKTSLA